MPDAMPSTHLSLHYHLVFSTKDRIGMIAPEWRERLHAFLGGIVRQLDGMPESGLFPRPCRGERSFFGQIPVACATG